MRKKYYRILIRKDEDPNRLHYYPQVLMWWGKWCNLFEWPILSYSNYNSALKCINDYIVKYKISNFELKVVEEEK